MLNYEVNDVKRHLSDLGHGYQRQLCELASGSFLKKLQVLILGGCWGGRGGGEGRGAWEEWKLAGHAAVNPGRIKSLYVSSIAAWWQATGCRETGLWDWAGIKMT
jgi:hypothetical protein